MSVTNLISSIVAIIIGVSIHEFAHAWMADRLGDPTGRHMGRLTLNPLKHFDPIGTLCLILFGFGWGKPVPFNPHNLHTPKRDAALIGLAGPLSNILLAIVMAIPLKYLAGSAISGMPFYSLLGHIFLVNILLFSLNILPFPPFDGSKIIGLIVPNRWHSSYQRYMEGGTVYVILFILFDSFVLQQIVGFSILDKIIGTITTLVIGVISLGS